jgi:hypothetical protein
MTWTELLFDTPRITPADMREAQRKADRAGAILSFGPPGSMSLRVLSADGNRVLGSLWMTGGNVDAFTGDTGAVLVWLAGEVPE